VMEHIHGVHAVSEHWHPFIDRRYGRTKARIKDEVVHVFRWARPEPRADVRMHYMLLSTDMLWRPTVEATMGTTTDGIVVCPTGHPATPPPARPLRESFNVKKLVTAIRGALNKNLWLGREKEYSAWWDAWEQRFPTTVPELQWTWPAVGATLSVQVPELPLPRKRKPVEIADPVEYTGYEAKDRKLRMANGQEADAVALGELVALEWLDGKTTRLGVGKILKMQDAGGHDVVETVQDDADLTIWWYDNPKNGANGHPAQMPLAKRSFARRCQAGHKYVQSCASCAGHGAMTEVMARSRVKVTGIKLTASGLLCKDDGKFSSYQQCLTHFKEFRKEAKKSTTTTKRALAAKA
jgi:hypothetical protein